MLDFDSAGCAQAKARQDIAKEANLETSAYPLLELWVGDDASGSTCLIKADEVDELASVQAWIEESHKAELQTAFVFVPIAPPKAYHAFLNRGQEKFLLLKAGDTLQTRKTESSKKLVELVDKICRQKD